MANYRNIEIGYWTDPKVEDEFTPEDKYFYLYLLTNSYTNICGCYEISMRAMTKETGYNEDTVYRLMARLETTHDVIRFNKATKEVLILNWHKYNWSSSINVVKAVESVAEYIKCDSFRKYVQDMIHGKSNAKSSAEPIAEPADTIQPKTKSKNEYPTEFENFWGIYPRKIDKGGAYKCYKARLADGWKPDELAIAAQKYADSCRREHTDSKYIKHPSSFLAATTPFADYIPRSGETLSNTEDDDPYGDWR